MTALPRVLLSLIVLDLIFLSIPAELNRLLTDRSSGPARALDALTRNGDTVALVIVVAFACSGPLVLLSPVEHLLGRLYFGGRRPTGREWHGVQATWDAVQTRAGVGARRYLLRIQDSDGLFASPACGRTVTVTERATRRLNQYHLAALLTHELGHQLGGHTWPVLLLTWYALPGRLLISVEQRTTRWADRAGLAGLSRAVFGGFTLLLAALLVLILRDHPEAAVIWVLLLAVVAPIALLPVRAFLRRRAAYEADVTAINLGYGPPLLDLLYTFAGTPADPAVRAGALSRQCRLSDPPFRSRINAVERRMGLLPD